MDKQNLTGQQVTAKSARGVITRTVVADMGDVLVLGTPEDYERAKTAGIDRFSVAFRRSDLIRVDSGIDMSASFKHNGQYHESLGHGAAGGGRQGSGRG